MRRVVILFFVLFLGCTSDKNTQEKDTDEITDGEIDCTTDSGIDTGISSDSGGDDTETDSGSDSADSGTEDSGNSDTGNADTGCVLDEGCECEPPDVYVFDECAPTLSLGCNSSCESDADCPDFYECASCAASTSCTSPDCQPACVLAYGPHAPVEEPLRIQPTYGPEDSAWPVLIQGTSFYIGALGHNLKLSDEQLGWEQFTPVSGCTLQAELPPRPAGTYPVWVSQYSGSAPWVLAGFYTYGQQSCVQPGFQCQSDADCCESPDVPMECQTGRCMRP